MSAPPGLAPTTQSRRNHDRRDLPVSAETLNRDAHKVLKASGVRRSASWVQRQVRAYMARADWGMPFAPYFAARVGMTAEQRACAMSDPEVACMLVYRDPTGEEAVRNVMRGPR